MAVMIKLKTDGTYPVCVPDPELPAVIADPPGVDATLIVLASTTLTTQYNVVVAKFVGNEPLVAKNTIAPTVSPCDVHPIFCELLVNVAVAFAVVAVENVSPFGEDLENPLRVTVPALPEAVPLITWIAQSWLFVVVIAGAVIVNDALLTIVWSGALPQSAVKLVPAVSVFGVTSPPPVID